MHFSDQSQIQTGSNLAFCVKMVFKPKMVNRVRFGVEIFGPQQRTQQFEWDNVKKIKGATIAAAARNLLGTQFFFQKKYILKQYFRYREWRKLRHV